MPVFRLDDRLVFPAVHHAEDGLLAVGGDLRPERLLLAYSKGIFPWYGENLPILWHSPDPRMVMTTRELVVQQREQPREAVFEERDEHVVFVLEVQVDGAVGDARGLGDL